MKRIPYGLAASELPGPKISGMTSSIPANKIYVTTDGGSDSGWSDADDVTR